MLILPSQVYRLVRKQPYLLNLLEKYLLLKELLRLKNNSYAFNKSSSPNTLIYTLLDPESNTFPNLGDRSQYSTQSFQKKSIRAIINPLLTCKSQSLDYNREFMSYDSFYVYFLSFCSLSRYCQCLNF